MSIMKKRIVLVNQSSGFLVVDDLNAYCTKYDCVSILCAGIKEGVRSINPKVQIDKICKYNKASTLRRLLTWSLGTIQVLFKLLFKYRNFEVVYYTNPPMACFSALLLRNKFRIVEYDIYPNALEAIGISDRHIIYRIWKSIKKKLYAKADAIYTLSEGMKEILLEYGEAEKIKVVPLWSASDDFKPICKEQNPFVKEHHLENKFVVMYSGNIGYTHSVECLIEVAKNMQTDNDVKFLMIGEGKKKTDLVAQAEELNLCNITFLPLQDFNVLPYSLASADLGIITLDENVSRVSVPSKTFNLMAVGVPLLAISNNDTEMFRLISKYQNGRCISKSNVDDIVAYIRELKSDKMLKQKYCNNSLLASKDFTFKNSELYL